MVVAERRSEFRFGPIALLPIAWSARGQDVLDRVAAPTRERGPMVGLQWRSDSAIRASRVVLRNERPPLLRGESAARQNFPRSTPCVDDLGNFGVRIPVLLEIDLLLLRVPILVSAIAGKTLLGIVRPPTAHGFFGVLPMSLGRAFDVVALIGAALLWIGVRHACLVPKSGSRCNRTRTRKHPSRSPGALLREKDSNLRPSGYEPDELPLLHPARLILQRPSPSCRATFARCRG